MPFRKELGQLALFAAPARHRRHRLSCVTALGNDPYANNPRTDRGCSEKYTGGDVLLLAQTPPGTRVGL